MATRATARFLSCLPIVAALVGCAAMAPDYPVELVPAFDSVHLCGLDVVPGQPLSVVDLERECTRIDAAAFRALVVSAEPGREALWKGGSLAVARSADAGDRHFYISAYGAFFLRPEVRGSYRIAASDRDAWRALIEDALSELRQAGS